MAHDHGARRWRAWYSALLRLYPAAFRDRFGEGMEQTFADLYRERRHADGIAAVFALCTFGETFVAIVKVHAAQLVRSPMTQDSVRLMKTVRTGAVLVAALMVTGIVTLMVLARGKDEDITGIVAPAALVAVVCVIVAIAASMAGRRRHQTSRP
jgi:hypothetical protein